LSGALAERLAQQIERHGPITFRDWMTAALYDPGEGYYTRKDRQRWGRAGDYRTSPERSELFAATFARYFVRLYQTLGSPDSWTIVECGAGNGQFAYILLSTLREHFEEVFGKTTLAFVEVNQAAREKLEQFRERVRFTSLVDLETVTSGVFFSNELLDAFPVHRLVKLNGELLELYVTNEVGTGFTWTTGPVTFRQELPHQLEEGQIIEVNPAIEGWFEQVTEKLERGFVVTVDYGAEATELYSYQDRPHGTLRAYSQHQFVENVLAAPGEYDITTSVDWSLVKRVGTNAGLRTIDFERQDRFLLREGLLEQLQAQLVESTSEAERAALTTTARDMIMPDGMAAHFQVLVQKK
jgi:SAM-dependent MidA family methyltransferase